MASASVNFVEFNGPSGGLPPEGMHASQAPLKDMALEDTIFLAMYTGNRWVSRGVDASDPSNVKLLRGAPSWPVISRAALLAFETGAVLEPPSKRAPYNYFCWYVDSCANEADCGNVHVLRLMSQILTGEGHSYPPARAIMGGTWYMPPVAQLSGSWNIPAIGFWMEQPNLSDKQEYPFYLRANANGAIMWEGIAVLLRHLNFSKVMVWHSSDSEGLTAKEIFMEKQAAWRLEVQSALCPDGEHTALPPDAAITLEQDPERGEKWKALLTQARSFNAHANVNAMSSLCPLYDLFHYLSINGLFGKGQFWSGSAITVAIYHQDYLYAIQFGRVMQGLFDDCPPPNANGSVNCWIMQTPMDGFVSLQPQEEGEMYPVFWKWWKSLRDRYHEVFEPWVAEQVEDVAFNDPIDGVFSSWWRLPSANFAFDSIWATLLSINSLLLRQGPNFTGSELLQEMRNTSFEGITGHVSFDDVGDRVITFNVKQYQRECPQSAQPSRELRSTAASKRTPEWGFDDISKLGTPQRRARKLRNSINSSNSSNSSNTSNGTQASSTGYPSDCSAQLGAFLSDTADVDLFEKYGECLVMRCEDMLPLIVKVLSGGQFENCEQLHVGLCQKCDFDLGSMSDTDTLPLGRIYVRNICGAQCPRGPVSAGEPPFHLSVDEPSCPGYPLPPQPLTCFGYPSAGKEVLLGTYTKTLTLSGTPFQFHSCAPKPPDRDLACSLGQYYNRIEAICEKCTPGRFTMALGQSQCLVCQAGSYSATMAASTCEACDLGRFVNTSEATHCLACPVGRFQDDVQQSACRDCIPGRYSTVEAQFECIHCELGRFAVSESASYCDACSPGRSTQDLGTESEAECRCQTGTYSTDANGTCMDCPEGMQCAFGADLSDWWRAQAGEDRKSLVYPLLEPMMWSDPQEPLDVFRCKSDTHCPGIRDPGKCGPDLMDRACAHCVEDHYWSGSACSRCSDFEASKFLFPILPILAMPGLILCMYLFFKDPLERWGSWQNNCTTIVFVLLNHYQVLALLSATSIQIPEVFRDSQSTWSFTNDLWSTFNAACVGIRNFNTKLIAQSLSPAVLFAATVSVYLSSLSLNQCADRCPVLDKNRLSNVYMSIVYTFFNSIAAISLTLFKCQENPNGQETLLADLSIICHSDEWTEMLGVGLASITVYCVGCGVLFSAVIWLATQRFQNYNFQMRWKFLFIKYRPDVWWWALPFLAKNFLYNLCFVVTPDATWQALYMLTITIIYGGGVSAFAPYRMRFANALEIIICISIGYACTLMLSLGDHNHHDNPLSKVGVFFTFFPLLLGTALLARVFYRRFISGYYARRGIKDISDFLECVHGLKGMNDQTVARFFTSLGEWDMYFMRNVSMMLMSDIFGVPNRKRCSVFRREDRDSKTAASSALAHMGSKDVMRIHEVIQEYAVAHGHVEPTADEGIALLDKEPSLVHSQEVEAIVLEEEINFHGLTEEAARPHDELKPGIGKRHLQKMTSPKPSPRERLGQ